MNYHEIKAQVKGLKDYEIQFLVFELLKEKDLSFTKLTEAYVESLKDESNKKNVLMTGLVYPLSYFFQRVKEKNVHDKNMKCKAAYNLLKGGFLSGAAVEKDFREYLKKNPWEEDEYGFPKT